MQSATNWTRTIKTLFTHMTAIRNEGSIVQFSEAGSGPTIGSPGVVMRCWDGRDLLSDLAAHTNASTGRHQHIREFFKKNGDRQGGICLDTCCAGRALRRKGHLWS